WGGEAQSHMRLVGRSAPDTRSAGEAPRLRRLDRSLREARQALLGECDQRVMVDLAGADQDHAPRAVAFAPPVGEVGQRNRLDAPFVAEDGTAEWLLVEG